LREKGYVMAGVEPLARTAGEGDQARKGLVGEGREELK